MVDAFWTVKGLVIEDNANFGFLLKNKT